MADANRECDDGYAYADFPSLKIDREIISIEQLLKEETRADG